MASDVSQKVKYIFYDKEAFSLRRAITLQSSMDGGFWIHSYSPLAIAAYGRTREESLLAFAMELSSAWHHIAVAPDEILATDARALKRKLVGLVESVRSRAEVLSELDQDA